MTTPTSAPIGLLDDLIICQNCGGPMTAGQDHQDLTFYQCINNTRDAPKRCKSPRIDTCKMDRDLLSQVALTLNAPVSHEATALPKLVITDDDIDHIFAKAADPQNHKTAILEFAQHPEAYTRPDVVQQTRAVLAKVVDHITVSEDDIIIHYAVSLPHCKLRLGGDYGVATPRSEIF